MPLLGRKNAIFHACGGQNSVLKGQNASKIGGNWAPDRSDFGEGGFYFFEIWGFQKSLGGFYYFEISPDFWEGGGFIKGGVFLIARYASLEKSGMECNR